MSKRRLEGKVALISGAAQGIGEETAKVLAREGVCVKFLSELLFDRDHQDRRRQNGTKFKPVISLKDLDFIEQVICSDIEKTPTLVKNLGQPGLDIQGTTGCDSYSKCHSE